MFSCRRRTTVAAMTESDEDLETVSRCDQGTGDTEPADVVRAFFERMEARDWAGAAALVAHDTHLRYTSTAEEFEGDNIVAIKKAYPEGWTIHVEEVMASGARVAAQARVVHGDETFWCAGFYTVHDGVIADAVEHWVTEGAEAPPQWRRRFTTEAT